MMEDLLTPQVCMDIDETPLDVGKDDTSDDSSSESNEPEIGDDEKVKLLLENQFSDSAQVPQELTDFEKEAKKNVFAIGEPAVQFQRLHCTACNIHLGSAPIGYLNRYIHPLLKVLLCKGCYEFYCSGEFDKDEDGSEMYCRWCGQGGKVMCCAQCAYVFCQKCVRQNLGKRTLEIIKDSDDWLCFGCNPTQLINLKIICTSLYEFIQEEIRLSRSLNNIERLKVDHSLCCLKVKAAKRKRDEDAPYTPHKDDWEDIKQRKPNSAKSSLSKPLIIDGASNSKNWNQKEEAQVVCTPDLLTLIEGDPSSLVPVSKSTELCSPAVLKCISKGESNQSLSNAKQQLIIPSKPMRLDGKKIYTIAPKPIITSAINLHRKSANTVRLQMPTIKFIPTVNKFPTVVNSIPAQITPGTKHEWYDKAAAVVSTITTTLSATLLNLTKEQRSARSVEQLANIHNKLQELLSSSVNSLIQARKNLRAEFLDDLNRLKFSNVYSHRNNISSAKYDGKNLAKNDVVIHEEDDNDDDVIIVNSETSPIKSIAQPTLIKKSTSEENNTRPYLKVRSVSQLLTVSSECITIPDDPPGPSEEADVVAIQEKDPLALVPEVYDQSSSSITNKDTDDTISNTFTNLCNNNLETKIKNSLTETKIEQLVGENMKIKIADIPENELKRVLSVRVLLSTNFQKNLPDNALKTSITSIDTNLTSDKDKNRSQDNESFTNIEFDLNSNSNLKEIEENNSVHNDLAFPDASEMTKNVDGRQEIINEELYKNGENPCMGFENNSDSSSSLQEAISNNDAAVNEYVNSVEQNCISVLGETNDSSECDNTILTDTFPILHLREKSSDYPNSDNLAVDQIINESGSGVENSK